MLFAQSLLILVVACCQAVTGSWDVEIKKAGHELYPRQSGGNIFSNPISIPGGGGISFSQPAPSVIVPVASAPASQPAASSAAPASSQPHSKSPASSSAAPGSSVSPPRGSNAPISVGGGGGSSGGNGGSGGGSAPAASSVSPQSTGGAVPASVPKFVVAAGMVAGAVAAAVA